MNRTEQPLDRTSWWRIAILGILGPEVFLNPKPSKVKKKKFRSGKGGTWELMAQSSGTLAPWLIGSMWS